MKSFLPVLIVAFLVATIVLPISRPAVSAAPNATAEMLKQLEGEFMKAALAKGSQGYMSYYADNAVEVPNGAGLIEGKAKIAEGMGCMALRVTKSSELADALKRGLAHQGTSLIEVMVDSAVPLLYAKKD